MTEGGVMAYGPRRRATRRAVMRWLGASAAGAVTLGRTPTRSLAAALATPATEPDPRPNIVLILLDDLRYDDIAAMPMVQRLLAAQGASGSAFFSTAAQCAPARASIFRGQYPHNHGVLRGSGEIGGLDQYIAQGNEESNIATWLQDAGYRTALVGKYMNGYREAVAESYVPPGWSDWNGVTQEGYTRFEINHNGEVVKYRSGQSEQYSTDVLGALAAQFIRDAAASGAPFFLHLSPRAPHGPVEPAARHAAAVPDIAAPRGPAFNEADVADKPDWVKNLPPLSSTVEAQIDQTYRGRWQTLLAADEMVGTLIAALDQSGTLANTYVVFTSDNGFHLGEHRIADGKGSPYEESIRVPLIVRGPGIAPGTTIDALASQIDLAPTFAAWADVPVPDFVDGRSLAPLLAGDDPGPWRHAVLAEHYVSRPERNTSDPAFKALRTEDYLYAEHSNGQRELYDLGRDPYELENLVESSDQALLDALATRLAAVAGCAGQGCRDIDAEPVPALRT
ncbi:MAG: sulfatase [Thermomicrobiales bacterium]